MKLQLKTISPIHIGTGETLEALEYVVHNNRFYAVPQRVFEGFLQTQPDPKSEVDAFAEWIGEKFHQLSDLETLKDNAHKARQEDKKKDFNQQLNALKANTNTLAFVDTRNQRAQYLQYLRKASPMQIELPFEPNARGGKSFSGQVRTALKCNNRPFLPGSSLKGALRTALFFHWLTTAADAKFVESIIKEQLGKSRQATDKQKKQFAKPLEEAAFYCATEIQKEGKTQLKTNDEKMDLMKLVSF